MNKLTVTQEKNVTNTNAPLDKVDSKLLQKLKHKFSTEQQQLFVQNFLLYAQCKDKREFIVSLDDVWEWLGFSRKDNAKRILQSNFECNTHFKIVFRRDEEKSGVLGRPSETILMTVETFKGLCMLANTDKAKVVRQYYIILEEVVHECILESAQLQALRGKEQAMMDFNRGKHTNYLGIFEHNGEQLAKFGYTDDIFDRWRRHLQAYGGDFVFHTIVECPENRLVEKIFKKHADIACRKVERVINNQKYIELIKLDDKFDIEKATKILLDVKKQVLDVMLEYKNVEHERNCELEKARMDHDLQIRQHELQMREIEYKQRLAEIELEKLKLQTHLLPQHTPAFAPSTQPKAVLQYTMNNQFVKKFDSVREAGKELQCDRNAISDVCRGRRANYKNYIWKFE